MSRFTIMTGLILCLGLSLYGASTQAAEPKLGPVAKEMCKVCEEACKQCAAECNKCEDMPHAKKCAEACKKCEDACRALAK